MMFVMLLRVCIHTGQTEKFAWPRWESNPRPLGLLVLVAQLAEHRGFDSHRGQANFLGCPVWMHTQSNITNIIFT